RGLGRSQQPAVQITVAIGEAQAGSAVVIRSGQIQPFRDISFVDEIAIVDAIGMLIEKNEDVRGPDNISHPEELYVFGIIMIGTGSRDISGIADHGVHGITAHPGGPTGPALLIAQHAVAWTS